MGSCSDKTLEPGPLTALNPDDFLEPPLPPFAEPRAREFAARTGPFLTVLDAAYGALEAESLIDLGGGFADLFREIDGVQRSAVDPEALANLQAAEDGFRVARDKTASLQSWLPPDVQAPPGFYVLYFRVVDAAGAPVAGALVEIDADFGNGHTRSTDGVGFCSFDVAVDVTVAWTVSLGGAVRASGVAAAHASFSRVDVTLP